MPFIPVQICVSSRATRNVTEKPCLGWGKTKRREGGREEEKPIFKRRQLWGCGEQLSKREAVRSWTQNLCLHTHTHTRERVMGETEGRRKGEEGKTGRQKM